MRSASDKARPGPDPTEIGIVLYPGVQLAAVLGLTDLFAIASRAASTGALRTTHWQAVDGAMVCVFDTDPGRPANPGAIVLPPTLVDLPEAATVAPIAIWLRQRHRAGATLASVCSGAFLLAETGLLAGRTASTHWSCAGQLQDRFPDIAVDVDRRLIDHADLITAGGVMAWVDVGLRLVERVLGPDVRQATARFLLAEAGPPASPTGFVPDLSHGDEAVLRVQHWLHARDARGATLAEMAAIARLEKRTFLRRFARATGMAPGEYCQRLKVARAVELLEASRKSSGEIAWSVGYANVASFSRVFRKFTGVSPGVYRQERAGRRHPGPGAPPEPGALKHDPEKLQTFRIRSCAKTIG